MNSTGTEARKKEDEIVVNSLLDHVIALVPEEKLTDEEFVRNLIDYVGEDLDQSIEYTARKDDLLAMVFSAYKEKYINTNYEDSNLFFNRHSRDKEKSFDCENNFKNG